MIALRKRWPAGRRDKAGHSLVELLVVSALFVILTVLLTSGFGTSARKRALVDCRKNLQKMYLALSIYQNDNNGAFPFLKGATNPAEPLSLLIPKSTTVTEMFICPGSEDKPLPEAASFARSNISYAYYMGMTTNDNSDEVLVSDAQVDAAPKNMGQQIFSSDGKKPGNNHGKEGGNFLWRDGELSASGPKAARDVRYPASVRMLNPQ